ncbi:MAG: choice-of-anchor V domain-containing protein [Myxococcales bacterium]|nr:MYXO-CTERM sorting domain-containing protein [Polyangiaceae bacterium]MDW8248755.1 choice-of-anchor V domain-containing protein [Myxococcales bacterium]
MSTSFLVRCSFSLTALALALAPSSVLAFSKGIASTSFGSSGCNQCHGGGTTPKVELTGPTKLDGGTQGIFTFTITDQGGKQSLGGLNVRADAGVLATGGPNAESTKTISGAKSLQEITHSSKKAAENGIVTFSFAWTAPTTPSGCAPVVLRAWGNAVNGSTTNGDAAEEAIWEVEVCNEGAAGTGGATGGGGSAGSGGATGGSSSSDAGSGGTSAGSITGGSTQAGAGGSAQAGSSAAPAPASEDDDGCSTRGPGREGSGVAVLLVLGLLASRQRR